MDIPELHRGRLLDHIQLVVRDVAASRRSYASVFEVLGIPIGGEADDYFWADELFVSSPESQAAHGALTGRHHIAFQAKDRATVDAFYAAGLAHGGRDNGGPSGPTIRAIMRPSCSIPTATISRPSSTARRTAARPR